MEIGVLLFVREFLTANSVIEQANRVVEIHPAIERQAERVKWITEWSEFAFRTDFPKLRNLVSHGNRVDVKQARVKPRPGNCPGKFILPFWNPEPGEVRLEGELFNAAVKNNVRIAKEERRIF